jgi:hypothetical protein
MLVDRIIDKSTWGMSERDFKDVVDEVIGLGSAYLA